MINIHPWILHSPTTGSHGSVEHSSAQLHHESHGGNSMTPSIRAAWCSVALWPNFAQCQPACPAIMVTLRIGGIQDHSHKGSMNKNDRTWVPLLLSVLQNRTSSFCTSNAAACQTRGVQCNPSCIFPLQKHGLGKLQYIPGWLWIFWAHTRTTIIMC